MPFVPASPSRAALLAALLLVLPAASQLSAQELSLDSLLSTPVSAASKYEQRVSQAPASVTILTSDDIRKFGFRNLGEALESVRGFYMTNDRNYAYLGARGFSRPSDYNNRILMLVNGHAINEQVWGSTPVGSDFMMPLEAIERIEVVRGPGSVLYGTNAMFGVINIVMKSAAQLNGVTVSARGGSGAARQAGVTIGGTSGSRLTFSASALLKREDGGSLYFSEYDDPSTQSGVVDGLDWERGGGGHATVSWGDLSLNAGVISRAKGIPTASYGLVFGDPRARTLDEYGWAELSFARQLGAAVRTSARVYGDGYRYDGAYPYDAGPAYMDYGDSRAVGGETMLIWDRDSRSRYSIGAEVRRVLRAENTTVETDGTRQSSDLPFTVGSLFAQNEFTLARWATLQSGLRLDAHSEASSAFSPRLALLLAPDARTSVKLLYGEAFRAPTPSEFAYDNFYYVPNSALRPERIRTAEIEVQRRLVAPLLVTLSTYHNVISNLTEPVSTPDDRLQFVNLEPVDAIGAELEAELRPAGPLAARATFGLQNNRNRATDATLTNSPESVGAISVMSKDVMGLFGAATLRYESGRRTLAGSATRAFTRTDVNLGYATDAATSRLRGLELSLRVTNLFDTRYSAPAGIDFLQAALEQQRRAVALRLTTRF
ncbi:MAG TPA: TonB-dependent receptor [Gemmatimonadaceae bacterium]|nr:TonB-dependent receptor [Gemmatimonadaceae bacterium]